MDKNRQKWTETDRSGQTQTETDKYEATGWRCQTCPYRVREGQDHLTQCSRYADLRIGIDFCTDEELVKFFGLILLRRKAMGCARS